MMAERSRRSSGIRATERYGTACRDAAGQWRARRQEGEHRFGFVCLSLCLVVLLGCAAETSTPPIPALAPGIARAWFLRGWDAPSGQTSVYGAAPVIFANGAPIGDIRTGTKFFRDLPPGTYRFTVQPFGLPTSQVGRRPIFRSSGRPAGSSATRKPVGHSRQTLSSSRRCRREWRRPIFPP